MTFSLILCLVLSNFLILILTDYLKRLLRKKDKSSKSNFSKVLKRYNSVEDLLQRLNNDVNAVLNNPNSSRLKNILGKTNSECTRFLEQCRLTDNPILQFLEEFDDTKNRK